MPDKDLWNILFVDDDPDICRQVKAALEKSFQEGVVTVTTKTSFPDTLGELENHRYDVLILDVRLGSHEVDQDTEAGVQTLDAIKARRFLPVIFYTALPAKVRDLESPPVWVVQKDAGIPALIEAINVVLDTGLPLVNRALIQHLEFIQRDYMWGFVLQHWRDLGKENDRITLAYFLARRLAMSLSGSGIEELAERLGYSGKDVFDEELAHPLRYYIMPPVSKLPMAGDILIDADQKYWVVLTPTCDFVPRKGGKTKADHVLLVECSPLENEKEYVEWRESPDSNYKKEALLNLLRNNRKAGQPDRYFFLPSAMILPNLVVDFQKTKTITGDDLKNYQRLASMDSPFSEAIILRYSQFYGRVGTPDLNCDIVLNSL
mgnify:CR=1 FL=1